MQVQKANMPVQTEPSSLFIFSEVPKVFQFFLNMFLLLDVWPFFLYAVLGFAKHNKTYEKQMSEQGQRYQTTNLADMEQRVCQHLTEARKEHPFCYVTTQQWRHLAHQLHKPKQTSCTSSQVTSIRKFMDLDHCMNQAYINPLGPRPATALSL